MVDRRVQKQWKFVEREDKSMRVTKKRVNKKDSRTSGPARQVKWVVLSRCSRKIAREWRLVLVVVWVGAGAVAWKDACLVKEDDAVAECWCHCYCARKARSILRERLVLADGRDGTEEDTDPTPILGATKPTPQTFTSYTFLITTSNCSFTNQCNF